MSPTFIIDWPVLILIGMIFGYGVRGTPRRSVFLTRAWISGKTVITLFILIVYYSYRLAPDWMFNYFVRASDIPGWMIVYIFFLYYFAFALGYLLKFETAKFQKAYPLLLMLLMLVLSIIVPLGLGDRYTMVGSMDEFVSGTAIPLAQSPVGKTPAILTGLLIPLALGLLLWSRRELFESS